jgi:hypothetical protein
MVASGAGISPHSGRAVEAFRHGLDCGAALVANPPRKAAKPRSSRTEHLLAELLQHVVGRGARHNLATHVADVPMHDVYEGEHRVVRVEVNCTSVSKGHPATLHDSL